MFIPVLHVSIFLCAYYSFCTNYCGCLWIIFVVCLFLVYISVILPVYMCKYSVFEIKWYKISSVYIALVVTCLGLVYYSCLLTLVVLFTYFFTWGSYLVYVFFLLPVHSLNEFKHALFDYMFYLYCWCHA